MHIRRAGRLAALALLALLMLAPTAGAQTSVTRPFAPTSVWNTPLADNAPLHSNSSGLVGELIRQGMAVGPWINTTQYSTPVYVVPKTQPKVRVHLDTPSSMYTNAWDAQRLRDQLASVPIPKTVRPAAGTDRHIVIWQPSTDTMWELWIAHNVPVDPCEWGRNDVLGWHAAWGARIKNVSTHRGSNDRPFGATASGLPLMGGLIRTAELQSGSIDHALAIAIPDVKAGEYVWPANRTDGAYTGANAIPEGTRFRLDPKLDVNSLPLTPVGRMIAKAAQRYGLVVRDRAGAVAFFAEDPLGLGTGVNPYPELFGGLSPKAVFGGFPWGSLEALKPGPPATTPVAGKTSSAPKMQPAAVNLR